MVYERLASDCMKNMNESTAAKELAVPDEGILSQGLCEYVCNLIVGVHWEDLDETEADVLAEVVVAHVDVLGARSELRKTCEFEGSGVVLKNLAVNDGFSANHFVPALAHFGK